MNNSCSACKNDSFIEEQYCHKCYTSLHTASCIDRKHVEFLQKNEKDLNNKIAQLKKELDELKQGKLTLMYIHSPYFEVIGLDVQNKIIYMRPREDIDMKKNKMPVVKKPAKKEMSKKMPMKKGK